MGRGFHLGTFMLFASFILLLVSTITSPVTTDLALFRVILTNSSTIRHSSLNFGVFGHTLLDGAVAPGTRPDQDFSSSKTVGYPLTSILSAAIAGSNGKNVSYTSSSIDRATGALILHPIATGIAFIAFLIAALSHRLGYLFAALVAAVAFLTSLLAMAVDFGIFVAVKRQINAFGSGAVVSANYSTGIWTTLAATILLFFATIFTCFSCFTDRRTRRSNNVNRDVY